MKIFFLLVTFGFLTVPGAFASRFNRQSSHSQNQKKTVDWPGRYQCEQCMPTSKKSPSPSPKTNPCWKYQITINRYDTEQRAQIVITGPDENLGIKALVSGDADTIDLRYTEAMDTTQTPLSFQRDDVLVSLQHREDDYLLRFRKIPSKVEGQSVITCPRDP